MDNADLNRVVDGIAASPSESGDLAEALTRIVFTARDTIPEADYASVTVRHSDGRLETIAATAPVVNRADELQYALREGPCYDAVTSDPVTYSPDLASDPSWPEYGPQVADLGLSSQLAIRLAERDGTTTGLNLYSCSKGAFQDDDELPLLFASHARVALGYAQKLHSLSGAIATREVIGKAIGIVMERYQISADRAFDFLIRVSQTSNAKLRDIALELVERTNDDATDSD